MKVLSKLRFLIPWIPFGGLLYIVVASDIFRKIDFRKSASQPDGFSHKLFFFGTRDTMVLWIWMCYQIAYISYIFNLS